jgi:hypothetical protein
MGFEFRRFLLYSVRISFKNQKFETSYGIWIQALVAVLELVLKSRNLKQVMGFQFMRFSLYSY